MKDQNALLKKCLHNDIPAIVFQGTDSCSIEILQSAMNIYKKHGCGEEFLYDFQLLINEFEGYQLENPSEIKLPKLTESEKELVRLDMNTVDLSKKK